MLLCTGVANCTYLLTLNITLKVRYTTLANILVHVGTIHPVLSPPPPPRKQSHAAIHAHTRTHAHTHT